MPPKHQTMVWRVMNTQQVVTSNEQLQAELDSFTAYFELLSQIDQRLIQEDPEYRKKYSQQQDTVENFSCA